MPKSFTRPLLAVIGLLLGAYPAGARPTRYHWERISVTQVSPSRLFTKLGLTHTTRYGFTRDGHTKRTPDRTFPPGLTDVVPSDAEHLLLVRGTSTGLAQFRARITATEREITEEAHWHLTADLLPPQGDAVYGPTVQQAIVPDALQTISVGDSDHSETYQVRVHINPDRTLTVTCQVGIPLSPAPATVSVWTPTQIWATAVTQSAAAGDQIVFQDNASDRQAALVGLGLPSGPSGSDYRLRLTLSPPAAGPAPISPGSTPGEVEAPPAHPQEENSPHP